MFACAEVGNALDAEAGKVRSRYLSPLEAPRLGGSARTYWTTIGSRAVSHANFALADQ